MSVGFSANEDIQQNALPSHCVFKGIPVLVFIYQHMNHVILMHQCEH